jgi:hypothetical protein
MPEHRKSAMYKLHTLLGSLEQKVASSLSQSYDKLVVVGLNHSKSEKYLKKMMVNLGLIAETFLKQRRIEKLLSNPSGRARLQVRGGGKKKNSLVGSASQQDASLRATNMYLDILVDGTLSKWVLTHLQLFSASCRHDIVQIYTFVNRNKRSKMIFTAYLLSTNPVILSTLLQNFPDPSVGRTSSTLVQEFIRSEPVCARVLKEKVLHLPMFAFCKSTDFDLATEAFSTVITLFTKHPATAVKHMISKYDEFIELYNTLLRSKQYITVRQALRGMHDILQSKQHFKFLIRYVNDPAQLHVILRSLFGKTQSTKLEAFAIFRIFVANPKKQQGVIDSMVEHMDRILALLDSLEVPKGLSTPGFQRSKLDCITRLKKLRPV